MASPATAPTIAALVVDLLAGTAASATLCVTATGNMARRPTTVTCPTAASGRETSQPGGSGGLHFAGLFWPTMLPCGLDSQSEVSRGYRCSILGCTFLFHRPSSRPRHLYGGQVTDSVLGGDDT